MPASATRMRRAPSNWNGLVTMPTVSTPSSLATRAITPAAPVPVPPPMPAATNTMCEPEIWLRISSMRLLGRRLADLGAGAGAEPLGQVDAELDAHARHSTGERLRVGVGDDELDPLEPGRDHVVDGIAAGAADADHGDSGAQVGQLG